MRLAARLACALACVATFSAVPVAACVKDVQSSDAALPHDTDGDHPPFAVCPTGVACGRCGSCSDCDFCIASPKGAPCQTGSDCAVSGYWTPFPTCFADPAFNPDAVIASDVASTVPPPSSPSSSACSASRCTTSAVMWPVAGALFVLAWRRRRVT